MMTYRDIENTTFLNNIASFFNGNRAHLVGAISWCDGTTVNIVNSIFYGNTADFWTVVMVMSCPTRVTDSTFDNNVGSFFIFNSNLTFSGYTKFENHYSREPLNKTIAEYPNLPIFQEGGAVTSYQSTVIFVGKSVLLKNKATHGGAILAKESTIVVYGEVTLSNNVAGNGSGGGVSLIQSNIEIRGLCNISNNRAVRGGGVHASSSHIAIYQPGTLGINHNVANNGGGMYLEVNPKLNGFKTKDSLDQTIDIQ